MFEEILDLIKQEGQQTVVDNQQIPNEYNNAVMAEAANTITGGLQNMAAGGGLQNIISMFTGQQQSGTNPIVSMMVGHLSNNLAKKFNINPGVAATVAGALIPAVMNSLVNRTRSDAPENSGFNLNNLIGSLTGGGSQSSGIDFQGLLNQFTGNQQSQGSLDDVLHNITQQAQDNQQQQNQGGGIASLIQGFFK